MLPLFLILIFRALFSNLCVVCCRGARAAIQSAMQMTLTKAVCVGQRQLHGVKSRGCVLNIIKYKNT